MNKQETAEAILVMQGYAGGGIVEEKDRDPDGVQGWHEYQEPHTPLFNFELYEYRIKPSPLEVYLHINRKTGKVVGWNHKHETMHQNPKIIHTLFREVIQ